MLDLNLIQVVGEFGFDWTKGGNQIHVQQENLVKEIIKRTKPDTPIIYT